VEGGWLASYIALWVLTVALAVLTLSQFRLIGLLYQRIGPGVARSLADGPEIGSKLDGLHGLTLQGVSWQRRLPAARDVLLVFMSPQCQTCDELMPHVKDFVARHRQQIDVLLVSVLGDLGMNQAYVRFAQLAALDYIIGPQLADALDIAATPYTLKVTRDGVIVAKGITNNYEHLVSFLAPSVGAELQEEVRHARATQS